MNHQFLLGADPECFVGDGTSVRSIIGKIGGTKEYPLPLPLGEGFAVQEDNVALEFNIPPSGSRAAFSGNIQKALDFLAQTVKDSHDLQLVKESAISFPEEELMEPAALMFGCDPDFNAWTGKKNPRPKADDWKLRSCGGHVHIGHKMTQEKKMLLGQACDLFLAVPSVLQDDGELRKQLYGKAGAVRFKPYGMEYRVLSNYWIFDPKLSSWVYDAVERAIDFVEQGNTLTTEEELITNCINKNNREVAAQLIDKYNLLMA